MPIDFMEQVWYNQRKSNLELERININELCEFSHKFFANLRREALLEPKGSCRLS